MKDKSVITIDDSNGTHRHSTAARNLSGGIATLRANHEVQEGADYPKEVETAPRMRVSFISWQKGSPKCYKPDKHTNGEVNPAQSLIPALALGNEVLLFAHSHEPHI